MKILLVPDLHFGAKSFGKDYPDKLNSRIQDQLFLMNYVYEQAIKLKVDRMILLGDIFDKEHPEPILISTFFEWLSKCTDSFFVDVILGNHDYKRVGQKATSILDTIPAARIKNCKVITNITTKKFDNLAITYVPFFDRKELNFEKNKDATTTLSKTIRDYIDENYLEYNIAVGHMAIEGSIYVGDEIPDEHNEIFLPISTFEKCDYTWMGHVHDPQILSKNPFVAHLGSLDKKTFKDGDKFICLYDSKNNNYKNIKLPCRNLIDIEINIPNDIKDTTEYVKNELQKFASTNQLDDSIIRIRIESNTIDSDSICKKELNKLLLSWNIQHVAEMTEKKRVEAIEAKTDIDETTDPNKAVDSFMKIINADDDFKQEVAIACKDIIKEVTQ